MIDYARSMLGWEQAHSTEFDPECDRPVVIFMPEGSKTHMGGTMRLGSRATVLQTTDCHAAKLYRPEDKKVHERHRHRYIPLHSVYVVGCFYYQFSMHLSDSVPTLSMYSNARFFDVGLYYSPICDAMSRQLIFLTWLILIRLLPSTLRP